MCRRIPAVLFLISASLAFGQLDSNSVTVTSSSAATPQPDQAIFNVTVGAGIGTSLNDVVSALSGSGITLANLSSVTTSLGGVATGIASGPAPPAPPALNWTFTLIVPLASTTATVVMLTGLKQSIPQKNSTLSLSFGIQGAQVSQQLQQSQPCAISDLLADARTQAQTLAASGGRILSGILALSSATSGCMVTVKFALLGS
jgi:uncharacterized protein YggE